MKSATSVAHGAANVLDSASFSSQAGTWCSVLTATRQKQTKTLPAGISQDDNTHERKSGKVGWHQRSDQQVQESVGKTPKSW